MTNLGYACINLTLADEGVTTNRGMIKKTFGEKGIAYASELALSNVQALYKILEWNVENGIRVFRVTSDLFPWASEYKIQAMPHYREIREILEACGKMPVRLSTHPGPFNKVAGIGTTLTNTIKDLEIHSEIFDLMNLEASPYNKINIHVGGAYGDKAETLKRFAQNFRLLSPHLQKRLTIENDDKPGLYTVQELVPLHEMTGIPIVFDYFHHRLHPGEQTEREAFETAYKTWTVKPTFHYSSSRRENENPEAKKEAHSDWLHEEIATYNYEVDIMLETKMKELSLLRYRQGILGAPQVEVASSAALPAA
ncbi:MAG TPA: UV DNA damage repair endonuclease UvsE [Flavisolibacter sp.]|jgi:UV DNA damage endonuclease|nr:UV DNA damage repair endonuclease UvsE [Flavisolibacter sp.]